MDLDLSKIKEIGLRLSQRASGFNRRTFVKKIKLGREPRIKVLVGFRGLGKTTALLQLMEDEKKVYFSLDHPFVMETTFYELGKAFIMSGYTTLLVDEVHHYKKWKAESKALYDEFPETTLILSGSAPLAFEPERRYEIIAVNPMSLREFIEIQGKKLEATDDFWKDVELSLRFLAAHSEVYEYYQKYLLGGGFPIYFTYGEKTLEAIYNSIRKSIWEDAPFLSRVAGEEIIVMEKILLSLATSSLGEFSIHSLANHLGIKKHKGYELLALLEKMRIVRLVRPLGQGPKLVRGEPKLMFYHPNLRSAVCNALGHAPDRGALREELAVFAFTERGWNIHTIKGKKKSPDYIVTKGKEKLIVEIGGPSKTKVQLKGFTEKTLILEERQLIALSLF